MSFLGSTVDWQAFYPDTRTPLSTMFTATVSATAVEFSDTKAHEIPRPGVVFINADVDLTANQLIYTIDNTAGSFIATSGFNGYILSDDGNTLDPIIGVTIDSKSTLKIAPDHVYFNANAIYVNVEGLSFQNKSTIVLDVTFGAGTAGQPNADAVTTGLLYEAGLGRQADNAGLNYWFGRHAAGLSFDAMAATFIQSAEFARNFGNPNTLSNQALITQLYKNVLSRPGETGGIDFWTHALDAGLSRSAALLDFAQSAENVQASAYLNNLALNLNNMFVVV